MRVLNHGNHSETFGDLGLRKPLEIRQRQCHALRFRQLRECLANGVRSSDGSRHPRRSLSMKPKLLPDNSRPASCSTVTADFSRAKAVDAAAAAMESARPRRFRARRRTSSRSSTPRTSPAKLPAHRQHWKESAGGHRGSRSGDRKAVAKRGPVAGFGARIHCGGGRRVSYVTPRSADLLFGCFLSFGRNSTSVREPMVQPFAGIAAVRTTPCSSVSGRTAVPESFVVHLLAWIVGHGRGFYRRRREHVGKSDGSRN